MLFENIDCCGNLEKTLHYINTNYNLLSVYHEPNPVLFYERWVLPVNQRQRDYSHCSILQTRGWRHRGYFTCTGHQPAGGRAGIPGGLTSEPILLTAVLFDSLTWRTDSFPPKSLAEETGHLSSQHLSSQHLSEHRENGVVLL